MSAIKKMNLGNSKGNTSAADRNDVLDAAIKTSWSKIAPFWPLKNLIAVNPIAGFEDLPFEEGLKQAQGYFQQKQLPAEMLQVNCQSIKWLQVFFDEGQSTIPMPNRHLGFLKSVLSMMQHDHHIHENDLHKCQWLNNLPEKPELVIRQALLKLGIATLNQTQFLTLMLTTLPGWAAHIQYRTNWSDPSHPYAITSSEYLAFRLIITCLLWPEAKTLLQWHQNALSTSDVNKVYHDIAATEENYKNQILKQLQAVEMHSKQGDRPDAQLIFCIDVRSEPFRRALEAQGHYETYGFAGFFGLPVAIQNAITGEYHNSCPVLLKPTQTVTEHSTCSHHACKKGYSTIQGIKKLYLSLKYTFATPFSLVETMGMGSAIWMALRSFLPRLAMKAQAAFKQLVGSHYDLVPDVQNIPIEYRISYAIKALEMMGLTENFAPIVVFCGHGSATQNNAYATALDCGACGGRHGAANARILAAILNDPIVRDSLAKRAINIPKDTLFVAAGHNTTTDEVSMYATDLSQDKLQQLSQLEQSLERSRVENSLWRAQTMGMRIQKNQAKKATTLRSQDWAQIRPEWGLAKNAAFIIGPRALTKNINLEGRSFLHSYDWQKDQDGASLTTILTAPMVVAQWINAQYLFSTLDNVAYGGGSKVTKNITGKIGIMQGNASDLMHGLPLQSVYKSDGEPYHKPMRLTVVVYAPKAHLNPILSEQMVLKKLFGNGWVHLICYDPMLNKKFNLQRDMTWASLAD